MSPMVIHMLMGMIYIGSPKGSDTFKQLDQALHLKSSPKLLETYRMIKGQYDEISDGKNSTSTLKVAGTMLLRDGFTVKDDFSDLMENYFSASSQKFSTTGQAQTLINEWTKENTNGLITEFDMKQKPRTTKLVLLSASYFKSDWKYQFKVEDTKPMDFMFGKETIKLEKGMNMYKIDELRMADMGTFQVIELPYNNSDFMMYIGLPSEKSMEALKELAGEFCPILFKDNLRKTEISHFQMPSFDVTVDIDLNEPLKTMGI